MTLGILLAIGILLAAVAGADLRRLADVRFKASWLIAVAFVLQLSIFAIPWTTRIFSGATVVIHVASYALLLAFAAVNIRQPGFGVATLGLACNTLVISLNHGRMPVALSVWRSTGRAAGSITRTGHYNNNVLASAHTHLAFLGDVLPLPFVGNAFSIGDFLLLVGATVFVYRRCANARWRRSACSPSSLRSSSRPSPNQQPEKPAPRPV